MKKFFFKLVRKSTDDFYKIVYEALIKSQKMFIITANPETFMIGYSNKEFNNILLSDTTTIVPDGIGIVKAARYLGIPVEERITGVDLTEKILRFANDLKKTIYLYGASEEVLYAFVMYIKEKYPHITIAGYVNGYGDNDDYVVQEVKRKQPDIILVALGVPKQEIVISKLVNNSTKGIFIGVGGTFDVLSGYKKRAPRIFIKLNLEWLYRIMAEPYRIKRFYNNNIKFIFEIRKLKQNMQQ